MFLVECLRGCGPGPGGGAAGAAGGRAVRPARTEPPGEPLTESVAWKEAPLLPGIPHFFLGESFLECRHASLADKWKGYVVIGRALYNPL